MDMSTSNNGYNNNRHDCTCHFDFGILHLNFNDDYHDEMLKFFNCDVDNGNMKKNKCDRDRLIDILLKWCNCGRVKCEIAIEVQRTQPQSNQLFIDNFIQLLKNKLKQVYANRDDDRFKVNEWNRITILPRNEYSPYLRSYWDCTCY